MKFIKERHFQHNLGVIENTKRWIAQHISVDGEHAGWLLEPRGVINKANLTFRVKFIVLLVRHFLSPTATENIVTWDMVVLVVTLVAGFVVDIPRLLLAVIHERAYKDTIMYLFPYLIFELCRFGVV